MKAGIPSDDGRAAAPAAFIRCQVTPCPDGQQERERITSMGKTLRSRPRPQWVIAPEPASKHASRKDSMNTVAGRRRTSLGSGYSRAMHACRNASTGSRDLENIACVHAFMV